MSIQVSIRSVHDDIVNVDEPLQLCFDVGFFVDFAQRGGARCFTRLDMPARQTPDEATRFFFPQADQDLAIAEDRRTGSRFGPMRGG